MSADEHLSPQQFPFFHGTRHTLQPGQVMEPGRHASNVGMGWPTHVYYTEHPHVAEHFAEQSQAPEHEPQAHAKVYRVEPVSGHEDDPFEPGEFGSYRAHRVRVLGEADYNWPPGDTP